MNTQRMRRITLNCCLYAIGLLLLVAQAGEGREAAHTLEIMSPSPQEDRHPVRRDCEATLLWEQNSQWEPDSEKVRLAWCAVEYPTNNHNSEEGENHDR